MAPSSTLAGLTWVGAALATVTLSLLMIPAAATNTSGGKSYTAKPLPSAANPVALTCRITPS